MEMKINRGHGLQRPVLPIECQPADLKNDPPRIVADELGKDGRRWYMWGRVCDRLAEEGKVMAPDLAYDGWINIQVAHQFLNWLTIRAILRPDGFTYQSTRRGMIRFTIYRKDDRFHA